MADALTEGVVVETPTGIVIKTQRPPIDNLSDRVMVLWGDKRKRTPEQNRKAWALMSEIAAYQGESKEEVYAEQQIAFASRNLEALQGKLFHLSEATVTDARAFITLLTNIVIEYGIPTNVPLIELCDDIGQYIYACLMHKRCAVCGLKAELHHVDHVGSGRDRTEIAHIGMRCLPLCRVHHTEAHTIGEKAFADRYHLIPVKIDEKICKKYNLRREKE